MSHQLRYLFVDMNSFFASVEQQEQPRLRGKPIAVLPSIVDTTCCIAASYEAKAFGIRTGTSVREAKLNCPAIQLIESRPKLYVEYHHRIVEAVESCFHIDQVCSIDEMHGKLLGDERDQTNATQLGYRIKARITHDIGQYIRCSIGIAPNIWLAKVATNYQKPDGLTIITRQDLLDKLDKFKLIDLPGIGKGMHRRLTANRIYTIQDLLALSEKKLASIWGSKVLGTIWWNQLHGYDLPPAPTHRRTVGHSHVLPPAERTVAGAHTVLVRLIHKAAMRLRRIEYTAGHMMVSIYYLEEPRWEVRLPLGTCCDTLTMLEAFNRAWPSRSTGRPFKVSVQLTDLTNSQSTSLPLFEDQNKRNRLSATMDKIDEKYGNHTLYFAAMHEGINSAPTRISFTQIPDEKDF
ncbi:DNA polymerase Y family protein [Poriferisphaera sp. WC338]|uniref:DNA polymerase Y family protein n=1 Tax=Poriferisphaera sp. WC338 TaxID=3425129 RepID=UPI003D81A667